MFEFFFKYSPVVFSQGTLASNYRLSVFMLLAVMFVFVLSLWVIYSKTTIEISNPLRVTLISLKFLALAVLLFLLLEPYVTISSVVPRKSSLIVLVDDSGSMSIQDSRAGKKRSDYAQALLGNAESPGLLHEFSRNFKMQVYKFSAGVDHLEQTSDLSTDGSATDLAEGLSFAADIGKAGAVSGVVVLTDGVNNGGADPLEVAALMKNNKLPVFTIGIGSEDSKDVELSKVTANRSVIENSVVEVASLLKSHGVGERAVELELREDGAILRKQTVRMKGSATRSTLKFSPRKKGFVQYSMKVIAGENETIPDNNTRSFLIDNRKKKTRVLYVEGHPRAEFKFLRRALDGDAGIELVSLLRTGEDKFYRQGISSQDELKDGYPASREALFEYDAILFGSIERRFFTEAQLELTAEFVARRGGGFLMLGGAQAFSRGGYAGSPIDKILPVQLLSSDETSHNSASQFRDTYRLLLTPDGYRSAVMRLASEPGENRALWDRLPNLEGYNALGRAKPGATILAVHPFSESDNPRVILAQQRFGRGRSMVFATSSSWFWQMSMPHTDMSHERFWRQMLRWLALPTPEPVEAKADRETYVPGQMVTLHTDVRDSTFQPVRDAKVTARIKKPGGDSAELNFKWAAGGKLSYESKFSPDNEGVYVVEVEARTRENELLGRTETAFLVEESKAEFNNAQLQSSFLKRIAEVSGGKYYHQDEALSLPAEISVRKSSYSKLMDHDLWDMPFWFALVLVILCVEWYVRRHYGLS